MREIDLTKSELFKNLTEVTLDEIHIDLHNNYDCAQILYDKINDQLSLKFIGTKSNSLNPSISLNFESVTITRVSLNVQSIAGNLTIDNFYRGRFEVNDKLREFSEDGRSYFYIGFYEDCSLELQSGEVKLIMNDGF